MLTYRNACIYEQDLHIAICDHVCVYEVFSMSDREGKNSLQVK